MAHSFDLLLDLIPLWAINLYDSSIQFIRQKLHISPVGVSSLLLIELVTSQVSLYYHCNNVSVYCFIYDLLKLECFLCLSIVIMYTIERIKDRKSGVQSKAIIVGDEKSGKTLLMNNVILLSLLYCSYRQCITAILESCLLYGNVISQ